MKKIILYILAFYSISIYSQQLEIGISTGTGFAYLFENADNSVNINYHAPLVISSSLKYNPNNSNIGVKLTYLNLDANMHGIDWQFGFNNGELFYGSVENRTFILGLEYLKQVKKINFGYHIGIGQTNERINFDERGTNKVENNFMVLNFGGLVQYAINDKVSLSLEPSLLWNDPIKSLSNYYRLAGEDVHLLLQLEARYKVN
jgi:hypothetical protein